MTAFGVSLLALTQQPVGEDMSTRADETVRWVHQARDLGFGHLTSGQHFLTAPPRQPRAVPVLARLIPESGRIRLAPTELYPGATQEAAFREAGPYLAAKYDSYSGWG